MSSKPIVVGTDGSKEALFAVEWAALEAVRRRLPLRIVSVPVMPSRMRAPNASPATVAHYLRENARQALDAATRRAKELVPEHTPETALLDGPPAVALLKAAAEVSLLVVGAHGGSALGAMVLGSVSRYAGLHAPCPIVVARRGHDGGSRQGGRRRGRPGSRRRRVRPSRSRRPPSVERG